MPVIQSKEHSDNLEPMLTTKEVAAIFKCSERHIQNVVKRGELPQPIKIGRAVRFLMKDIRRGLNGDSFDGLSNQAI